MYCGHGLNGANKDTRSEVDGCCIPCFEKMNTEDVHIEGWKGNSGFEIKEFPLLYKVIEWKKDKYSNEIKRTGHKVRKEAVDLVWDCIKKFDKGITIKASSVAREICIAKKDTHYIHDGKFSFSLFFGTRGKGYFKLFYYPTKVLESKGLIMYDEKGITRICD